MKSASKCPVCERLASMSPLGISVNNLSLGVLAGLGIGQAISAAQFSAVITLAAVGFVLSIAASKLTRYLSAKSHRKAQDRAILELERRLERLIPLRHMKAHGMHSHKPHALEEPESNWMPVARRSRTNSLPS